MATGTSGFGGGLQWGFILALLINDYYRMMGMLV